MSSSQVQAQAAYIPTSKSKPLEIKTASIPKPGNKEIVIKNAAVAINPIDWMIQDMGDDLFNWIQYPFISGSDVAGQVISVGNGITRFKVGDRVLGHALGFGNNTAAEGAFQTHVLLKENMTSPIPSSLSYESASVLPLGISTAACAMFQKDYLSLNYPTVPAAKPTGQTLLVWAGASSVGSNAIQLAVAAGYEVITTASPKNFDYVKKLGASHACDYRSATITEDLLAAFKGRKIAGAIAMLPGSAEPCVQVVHKTPGSKFVSMCLPPPEKLPEGVSAKFVFGNSLKDNEVGAVIYQDFLPKALAQGKYVAAPEPEVVGKGLDAIQAAFEKQKNGVSAKKIVVTL